MEQIEVEQKLLDCWKIVDDIKTLQTAIKQKLLTVEETHDILNSLSVLFDLKFRDCASSLQQLNRQENDRKHWVEGVFNKNAS